MKNRTTIKITAAQHNELWQLIVDTCPEGCADLPRLALVNALKDGRDLPVEVIPELRRWAIDMTTFDEPGTKRIGQALLRRLS